MKSKIYWFTGQPGAGKTVLSKLLKEYLENKYNKKVQHVDGDDLRLLTQNTNYSKEGRFENIKRAQTIAQYLQNKNYDVVVSLVSPYRELREELKSKSDVIEIYVHTSEIRGRENFHVLEYEKPENNFIEINTTNNSPKKSLKELLDKINLYTKNNNKLDGVLKMGKESKTYQIRYNTLSKDDSERWRLIEDGKEVLVSDIIINGFTHTTKDWIPEIDDYKWHVSCVGYCDIKNNVAYINTIKEDSVLVRHILKTITYRLITTFITILITYLLNIPIIVSSILVVGELIIKPFIYFLHERFWYKKIQIKKK